MSILRVGEEFGYRSFRRPRVHLFLFDFLLPLFFRLCALWTSDNALVALTRLLLNNVFRSSNLSSFLIIVVYYISIFEFIDFLFYINEK